MAQKQGWSRTDPRVTVADYNPEIKHVEMNPKNVPNASFDAGRVTVKTGKHAAVVATRIKPPRRSL